MDENLALRDAAIRHRRLLSLRWGEAVPYEELARGFPYGERRIKLVGPQGVFKPKEMTDGALTLLSTLASTYEDEHLDGDEVLYDYAPASREYENDGMKRIASWALVDRARRKRSRMVSHAITMDETYDHLSPRLVGATFRFRGAVLTAPPSLRRSPRFLATSAPFWP